MCTLTNAYVETPKKVGEILNAGTYARNADGTPITTTVYLDGYNPATSTWKIFGETVPDPSNAWAGMSMITFTDEHVGTWTMSFRAVDKNGNGCGIGPWTLIINPSDISMTLQSDKMSISSGDNVTFYGTYKPNSDINIFIEGTIRKHIASVKTNSVGNYMVSAKLTSDKYVMLKIGACTAGYLGLECISLYDISNYLYIYVYPPTSSQCQSIVNKTIVPDKTTINTGESINFKVKIENTSSKNCNIYDNDSSIPYNDTKLTPSPFILDSSGCGETNITFGTAGTYNIYAATDYSIESTNIVKITVMKGGIPISCQNILDNSITVTPTKVKEGESVNIKIRMSGESGKKWKIFNDISWGGDKFVADGGVLDNNGCGEANVTLPLGNYNLYALACGSWISNETGILCSAGSNRISVVVTKEGIPVKCSEPQLYVNGKQGTIIIESTPATIELTHCGESNDDYIISRTDLFPDDDFAKGITDSNGIAKATYNIPIDGIYEFQSAEDCSSVFSTCIQHGNTVTVRAGKVPEPGTGICGMIGLSDQDCKYLTYGALAIGGLIILKIVSDLIPKSK